MQPNEMSAYKGDKPYIFVSYAHKDSEVVIPLIKALQDSGYRIWFDLGIEVGTEWSNNIANHLRDCSAFLFFTSQNSVNSENCLDEVAYAKSYNKAAVLVYLEEDVVLPTGTEMQTARFQRMYANRQPNVESFVKGFAETEIFDTCRESGEYVISAPSPITNEKSTEMPTAKKPVKLGKGAYIGIAAAVVAIIVAIIVFMGIGGEDKPKTEDKKPEVITLSDKLEDHTFRLDGKVYKLPFNYSTLVADGWTIYTPTISSESYISGQSEETIIIVKDGKSVSISVYNDGENAKKLKDCLVGGIMVYADDITDFCIAAEVTPKTTELEMIEKFGTPAERSEYANYIRLTWSFGEMSQVQANIYDSDNTDQNHIQIKHYVLSNEKFEAKKEAPAYLNNYTAPTELGDNLYSAVFWVNGDYYELPVPLREFTKNGWTITAGSSALISGQKESYTLSKDETKITVEVYNASLYKTTPENCVVTKISCESTDKVQLQLPGGVTLGMTKAELKKVAPKTLTVYEGSYSTSYSYSEYKERDYYLSISVENETDTVNRISMTNDISGLLAE